MNADLCSWHHSMTFSLYTGSFNGYKVDGLAPSCLSIRVVCANKTDLL
jgi:hypothetical protein